MWGMKFLNNFYYNVNDVKTIALRFEKYTRSSFKVNFFGGLNLLILLLSFNNVDAESATLIKNESLREKPFIDGKIVIPLKQGQNIDIQKREGSWYFVVSQTKKGWVPMLSIRKTKPFQNTSKGTVVAVNTGRASSGGSVVNTTGIRGFQAQDLKSATFNDSAITAVEKFRVKQEDALVFATQGNLSIHNITLSPTEIQTGVKK